MLFELIHFVYVLQDRGSKEKSPADDLSPRSPPLESKVNLLQELTRILHELFNNPVQIPWDASIFGVDGSHYIYLCKTSWNSFRVPRC